MSGAFPSSPIEIRLQDTMGGHTIANHVLNNPLRPTGHLSALEFMNRGKVIADAELNRKRPRKRSGN
jgi:hypothetical protein